MVKLTTEAGNSKPGRPEIAMHIRPAQPDDTPALMALTAGTGVFKPYEVEVLKDVLDDYHARDADSQHVAVVADDHGKLVGYAYYAPDVMTDRTWYLYWIAVSKDIQAKGVGSKIMRHVEEDIRKRNGRLLLLETSSMPHSELTRKFYAKQGYAVAAVIQDFYSDGDSMVIFRKRIVGEDAPAK
jgi:ribosomal protein S18 acetylase RimI-like enzyme